MGFLAPAVPWIVKGGAALAGSLFGRKAESGAANRYPEEKTALAGGQAAGQQLGTFGGQAIGLGLPAARKAVGYYQTLLGGNRAAMAQATAAPRAAITDTYRGAEANLDRSGVQGASRMRAEAELSRDRAAQIAGLTTGVQPAAAAALSSLGPTLTGQGATSTSAAGTVWSNLLGEGARNRVYARQEGENTGTEIGKLIFDTIAGTSWGRKNVPQTGPPAPGGGYPGYPGGYPGTPPYFPMNR